MALASTPSSHTEKFGHPCLAHWLLDREVTYLNHGTVGATPRQILAVQQELRDEIERQPSRFLLRELADPLAGRPGTGEPRLRRAAREVAAFFNARGEDLVFTDNATTAINAVLRSFAFRPGDEILLLDHVYGAIRKAAEYVARCTGASVRSVALPFPQITEEGALLAVERGLTPRTRLVIVDHVTSASALVLPVAAIAEVCRKHGVAVLVDGAHAVGAIPVDLPAIGADWYTGNLHKWGWAPRSCAILWVDPARQAQLHPTTISWGLDKGFAEEFDWLGTRDPTPWLAAPAALSLMQEFGLEAVRHYNHELAWFAGNHLAECWGTPWTVPRSMTGTMVTVPLPEALGSTQAEADRLRDALLFDEHIEVQLSAAFGRVWARVSAQVYNERSDVERLARAVLAWLP